MIIWRGRGGVIALIVFACFLLADFASHAAYHDPSYLATHGWLRLVAFWVSAGIVFALRSWLGVGKDRTVLDKATGREIKLSSEGTLFFVPARYWPAILLVLGLVFYFVRV